MRVVEVPMESRREVEKFIGGEWKDDREHDGRIYCIRVKVNDEETPFNIEVRFSNTVLCTKPHDLERDLGDDDWEEVAKTKIKHEVGNRLLAGKSPTEPIRLCIDYREVGSLLLPDAL
jgi:hypothetical protein